MLTDILKAAILGIVEGLTEFIPVSSTGHLILCGNSLNFTGEFADVFEVAIQFGAILAVIVLYQDRFRSLFNLKLSSENSLSSNTFSGVRALLLLCICSMPALVIGYLLRKEIKLLFDPLVVAIGLIAGAILMLAVEQTKHRSRTASLDHITYHQAFYIGLFQCFSLWPGMSRAASTIVGGILAGLDRKTAAEFSFFAAVPIISVISVYDLVSHREFLSANDLIIFATGFITAFIVSIFAIRFLITFLSTHSLKPFAFYRIGLGLLVLLILNR
ncbi:undecaprenyl-diphosphate phosphatase [bacterium]|nr:undecaprenyl-diphosphate phosphatase [bacterium]